MGPGEGREIQCTVRNLKIFRSEFVLMEQETRGVLSRIIIQD